VVQIVFSGVAPGIALLTYFYLRHEHESEPVGYILRSFIFGILLVFPLMFIDYIIQTEFGGREEVKLVSSYRRVCQMVRRLLYGLYSSAF